MRYMFIVTSSHRAEPTPEMMQAMHKLAQREIQAGRMLDDGGSRRWRWAARCRSRRAN